MPIAEEYPISENAVLSVKGHPSLWLEYNVQPAEKLAEVRLIFDGATVARMKLPYPEDATMEAALIDAFKEYGYRRYDTHNEKDAD